ncbi:MAG TPA: protein-glutamate O-methyltransferase CheR [Bacilli bacterium]
MEDQDFAAFIQKVNAATSIDLSQYKEAQMKRRLTSLMNKNGYHKFVIYFEEMMKDKSLFYEFLDRMTINVSEFWRNPNRWEVLEQKFIPQLLSSNRRLKCWSAACSTGEEPYSLAMILAHMKVLSEARIEASDIDEGALEKAAKAIYLERSLKDVPPDYAKLYFQQNGLNFTVTNELRKAIHFRKGNLLNDHFGSNFDLIICRNVMIYFTEEAKQKLYMKFSQALRPGGILFVGSTEQIFSPEKFDLESADIFYYRKRKHESV